MNSAGTSSCHVLGTPLQSTDYATLRADLPALASGESGVNCIDFTNTHIVTLRRHDPTFRDLIGFVDRFIPDGMPLIWCMNRQGAGMKDRIYGPTFMDRCLSDPTLKGSHFLVGGSEECGCRLRERYAGSANMVGGFHGAVAADGSMSPADEKAVLAEIQRLSPDYVWVGLGAPKQYAWISRYLPSIRRGVILSVGFAFDVNAGMKPDAPMWMQRAGLTWLFRMGSEPRRLAGRYLKYNSLFLWYLLRDGLAGRAFAPECGSARKEK